jgi:Predicted membrane-bound metal-dependent hydrolases
MDSVTQAVLGAGIQGALLGRHQGRKALLYGALLGTLPDLDVIVSYADPVSAMTHHRGFSHSVFVLTALAAAATALIRWRWPHAPYSARRLFITLWLALVTHPLLDAFTSYGTQLMWPWEPVPQSWSSLFIIDPAFTLPLLAAVLAGAVRGMGERARKAMAWTLAYCCAYIGFSLAGKALAEHRVVAALAAQGVRAEAVFSSPMPFNTLLWRVVVREGDAYYEGVSGWFDRDEPETLRQPLNVALAGALAESPQFARLAWFTGGWLRLDDIDGRLVVSDLRMGMAGHYTFRFVMAERGADGRWQAVTPYRWQSYRGGWAELQRVLARIGGAAPLPLAQWAAQVLR